MARSSILGADRAPAHPGGRSADRLGPSDRSDTGSDSLGTPESRADTDSSGTGERGPVAGREQREGGDILPDRVQRLPEGEGFPEADPDSEDFADPDAGPEQA